jgi:hypothetical protein
MTKCRWPANRQVIDTELISDCRLFGRRGGTETLWA